MNGWVNGTIINYSSWQMMEGITIVDGGHNPDTNIVDGGSQLWRM